MKLTETEKQEVITKFLNLIEEYDYPNNPFKYNDESILKNFNYYYPQILRRAYKHMFLRDFITPIEVRRLCSEKRNSLLEAVRAVETKRQEKDFKNE